ncbi:hypothetical protein NIES298_00190 [Microcystis aeruginosa NIES-298]|nr:hypothetical protein NIES298_00190 [Microcystis aeruginosa NIES-298]
MAREFLTLSKRTGGDSPTALFTSDQSLYYNRPLVKIKNLPLGEEPVVSIQEN